MASQFAFPLTPPVGAPSPPQKSQPKPEPLVNPLLSKNVSSLPFKQSLGSDAAAAQRPHHTASSSDGLRQRRKSKDDAPFRPPKANLTMGGGDFSGELNENDLGTRNESDMSMTLRPSGSNDSDAESYDRWVLVYGYATSAQYDAILRRFETFGKVVNRRGVCHPGKSNWVALQYESSLQAEKALCQQNSMIMDGIMVGVMRMNRSLRESLEWNFIAPSHGTATNVDAGSLEEQSLDGMFRDSLASQRTPHEMTEQDVLLVSGDKEFHRPRGGNKNVCEKFFSWLYGWEMSDSGGAARLSK